MKKYILLGSVVGLSFLASCNLNTRWYTPTRLCEFERGASPEEVQMVIDREIFMEGKVGEGSYNVYRRWITASHANYDLFYYENNQLIYWGSIDDFKVHDSEKIRKIGEDMTVLIMEEID